MLKLHQSRIFAIYLLAYIISTTYFTIYPINYDFLLIIIALLITLAFLFKKKRVLIPFLFIIVILIANQRIFINSYEDNLLIDNSIKAQIVSEPRIFGNSQSFSIKANDRKLSVVTNQFPEYNFGDYVEVIGEVEKVTISDEFYGFYKANNIEATYYYPEIKKVDGEKSVILELRKRLIFVRQKYEDIISRTFPEPQAGLLSGILLGSRSDLSKDFSDLLARTGVIHIVALSGYNITIIAAFMASVGKSFSRKKVFLFSTLGIWAFVFATGLSASVVRAAIMGTLLLIASRFGRKSSAFISVLFASTLMVFINPNILLYDIGFQLSFAAVCGILFLAPKLEVLLNVKNSWAAKLLIATFSAQIFTIPLISYHFERISIISLLTNFLVLPFIPFVMFVGFVSSSTGFISLWLSEKLSIIAWIVLSYYIQLVEFLGSLNYAEVSYKISLITMIAMYVILLEIVLIIKRNKK